VEDSDKRIAEETVRQVGHLPEFVKTFVTNKITTGYLKSTRLI